MSNQPTALTIVTVAADIIAQSQGWANLAEAQRDTESFLALESDIYGWGDGESPIIQWEEGPYNWTLDESITGPVTSYLKKFGLFCEPINSWALGIYKNGEETVPLCETRGFDGQYDTF